MNQEKEVFSYYPSQIEICFSEQCNMDCDYCFVDKSNPSIVRIDQIRKAIDKFFKMPVKKHTVTLTTAESLKYPDLTKETLNYLFHKANLMKIDLIVILTTNGLMLNNEMRKFLDSFDERLQLNISWDGDIGSHESHRKLRGGKGAFNESLSNFMALENKSRPRVIFTIAPSEVGKIKSNVESILSKGFKKIDLFPQMLYSWSDRELDELNGEMKKVVEMINCHKDVNLRLLNRLWGKSHYDKILLGCDGKFYLYEMILVLNHKKRGNFTIGDSEEGIDLEKRDYLFRGLFDRARKEANINCNSCPNKGICHVPLPLFLWCKSKGEDFNKYLKGFCRISRDFVELSNSINEKSRNELDSNKLSRGRSKNREFLLRYAEAIGADKDSIDFSKDMLEILEKIDPRRVNRYELSFKVKGDKISPKIRILDMDIDSYSCKNQKIFSRRVDFFEKIIRINGLEEYNKKVIDALRKISNTPMDLYFGADVRGTERLFAFWLIFGGVKRDGNVNFCKYDLKRIVEALLLASGLKRPEKIREDILNFGFDISKEGIFYKLYYLCKEKVLRGRLEQRMVELNRELQGQRYFYFFSRMYNQAGKMIKEKLFMEFLEDIPNRGEIMEEIIKRISKIGGINFDVEKVKLVLEKCGGRISLISFEEDGTTTFYIRLMNDGKK